MSVTALGSLSVKREALLAVSYTPAVAPVAIATRLPSGLMAAAVTLAGNGIRFDT